MSKSNNANKAGNNSATSKDNVEDAVIKPAASAVKMTDYVHGRGIAGEVKHWPCHLVDTDAEGNVRFRGSDDIIGKVDNSVLTKEAQEFIEQAAAEASSVPIVSETVVTAAARRMLEEARQAGETPDPSAAAIAAAADAADAHAATAAEATDAAVDQTTASTAADPQPVKTETASKETTSTTKETEMNTAAKTTTKTTKTNNGAAKMTGFWGTTLKVLFWTLVMIAALAAILFSTNVVAAYLAELALPGIWATVAEFVTLAVAVALEAFVIIKGMGKVSDAIDDYNTSNFIASVREAAAAAPAAA